MFSRWYTTNYFTFGNKLTNTLNLCNITFSCYLLCNVSLLEVWHVTNFLTILHWLNKVFARWSLGRNWKPVSVSSFRYPSGCLAAKVKTFPHRLFYMSGASWLLVRSNSLLAITAHFMTAAFKTAQTEFECSTVSRWVDGDKSFHHQHLLALQLSSSQLH